MQESIARKYVMLQILLAAGIAYFLIILSSSECFSDHSNRLTVLLRYLNFFDNVTMGPPEEGIGPYAPVALRNLFSSLRYLHTSTSELYIVLLCMFGHIV